jgi:tRNA threonylcarbamoyladenosine biosynthesis protein TsaE
MSNSQFTSHNLSDTKKIAEDFLDSLKPISEATVVALSGDLGAGKTAFTKAVALILGVGENVTSPTFVIEKIYGLTGQPFKHLIHIDAYRIEDARELLHLGWKEIIQDPGNLILIEWPERVSDVIPADAKKISFTFIDETTRKIEFQNTWLKK